MTVKIFALEELCTFTDPTKRVTCYYMQSDLVDRVPWAFAANPSRVTLNKAPMAYYC
jgi:hypothetical protein